MTDINSEQNSPIQGEDIKADLSKPSKPEKPPSYNKEMILKTIEIRLEGIEESTKRSRITFIVLIITCCSMLITVFNAYLSFTRTRAFDNQYKYKATNLVNITGFVTKFKNNETYGLPAELFGIKLNDTSNISENDEIIILEKINSELLSKNDLIDSDNFNLLFKSSDKTLNTKIKNKFFSDQIDEENVIRAFWNGRLAEYLFDDDVSQYYNAENHLNKFILEKIFPELEWEFKSSEITLPISLYEENKRALSKEWIENQNVRINLLGISVNVDQFSLIGSFTLMIISIWMLFSSRRENRAIVTLLRDVKKEVGKPDGEKDTSDEWDIANLTLHGIAHRLIFAQIGRNDLPMSEREIFDEGYKNHEKLFNNLTELITKFIRLISYTLLFLPVFTILIILLVDYYTTTNTLYPYSNNPVEYFINRNINFSSKIITEIKFGIGFGILTFLVCMSCIIFQGRTANALREFEKRLGKEKNPSDTDSWWENKVKPFKEKIKNEFIKIGKSIKDEVVKK